MWPADYSQSPASKKQYSGILELSPFLCFQIIVPSSTDSKNVLISHLGVTQHQSKSPFCTKLCHCTVWRPKVLSANVSRSVPLAIFIIDPSFWKENLMSEAHWPAILPFKKQFTFIEPGANTIWEKQGVQRCNRYSRKIVTCSLLCQDGWWEGES